jgi:hypothetical protein
MKSIQFVFALHDHQPVGNFDHVFAHAYEVAYLPFLELLEAFPAFRVCLHHTGPLLQWIANNRRSYLERLGVLVQRNQVELLGGAFYEPILPVIPEADRVGQIVAMSDWLETVFGRRPRGMWLAERVWEPTLPRAMAAAGIEYTVLDDSHFKSVGIAENSALGYYLTEDQGDTVAVFPINQTVRQRIPYNPVEEVIGHLEYLAAEDAARTVVMADDGEKFGVWPDSNRHCYEDGWMYRFVEMVGNNNDWLQMKTFSEVLDGTAPLGRVYLPTASYVEMMEWAMPAASIRAYHELVRELKNRGEADRLGVFVRGGFWRSFFAKYEESNHIHKKMLHVSRKLSALPDDQKTTAEYATALDHLWQGQCNCAYWHGVFGGLYLTNLRNALYHHLITAEEGADQLAGRLDGIHFTARDFATDGHPDLIVETPAQVLHFKPHLGGMLVEHDIRAARFNMLDTLARRREAYHDQLDGEADGEAKWVKEDDLAKYLSVDWYRRGSLIDHFISDDLTPEQFRRMEWLDHGDFVNAPYETQWQLTPEGAHIGMTREGTVVSPAGPLPVRITRHITLTDDRAGYAVRYRVTNLGDKRLQSRFGVEFHVNLLAGDADDRIHEIDGVNLGAENRMISLGTVPDVRTFRVRDGWLKLCAEWSVSIPATYWRLPIETVSSSEFGIERVYQATSMLPNWMISLAPGESFEVTISHRVDVATQK